MNASRPCPEPGCPNLVPCPAHYRRPFASAGRTLAHLYKTRRWQRLRAEHLALANLCCLCFAENHIVLATTVDHVNPHRGDEAAFWRGPFMGLCKTHHDAKTGRETRERVKV